MMASRGPVPADIFWIFIIASFYLPTTVTTVLIDTTTKAPKALSCFGCSNYDIHNVYMAWCPLNGSVDPTIAYLDTNCTGVCSTRANMAQATVRRGCSTDLWGLPNPLPEDGCYNWKSEVLCICRTNGCNVLPLGEPGDKQLDDHLKTPEALESSILGVTALPNARACYECQNYDSAGKYYDFCPLNGLVDPTRAYLNTNCTGQCFIHTDDRNRNLVFRGCTAGKWGLPNPLPPDGCYPWYNEIWCVCRSNGCNGLKMGPPETKQFDYLVDYSKIGTSHASHRLASSFTLFVSFLLVAAFSCRAVIRRDTN